MIFFDRPAFSAVFLMIQAASMVLLGGGMGRDQDGIPGFTEIKILKSTRGGGVGGRYHAHHAYGSRDPLGTKGFILIDHAVGLWVTEVVMHMLRSVAIFNDLVFDHAYISLCMGHLSHGDPDLVCPYSGPLINSSTCSWLNFAKTA